MKERVNYPTHSMRIADSIWERLRLHKHIRRLTWNRLLDRFMKLDADAVGEEVDEI